MKRLLLILALLSASCSAQILQAVVASQGTPAAPTAVTFNNAGTMTRVAGASYSVAQSVTAGGTNTVAFAMVAWDNTASKSITAITYNGVAMTLGCGPYTNATTNAYTAIYWVLSPATGSNTLAITATAGTNEIIANLVSFNGVNQTTPIHNCNSASSGSGNPSLAITSGTNEISVSVVNPGNGTISATNQTSDGFTNTATYAGGSDHATTPAASVTHTWTAAGSTWTIGGGSIQP